VALCFAELSSRFDTTGGPYVFARAAFGDFVGFEIGWMQWFSRATSQASIMAATAVALGYYWPALKEGWLRAGFMVALTLIFGGIGYLMVAAGWPRAPFVLGLVLGKIAENYLYISTARYGADWLTRPVVLVLIAILVVIQLWLVAAAVDALMARQTTVLVPTAVASSVLLVLSAGLLWYVVSFDARLRHWGRRG